MPTSSLSARTFISKTRPKNVFKIPVAHGEGRYYADDKTLDALEANNQVIYRYCDEHGSISDAANPSGPCVTSPESAIRAGMFPA